ncbi:MAG: hypothetical protein HQL32_15525 [Planctomycetes bacterium]|nr:hypothetical protein [Planctomycetota bacterium]
MVKSKEELQKQIQVLEKKLPVLVEKAKTLPQVEVVEDDGNKKTINPSLNALKSSRKVAKKLKHLRSLLKRKAS